MFKQNYINIFENAGGNITIAYATCGDDPLQIGEVQYLSIEKSDLHTIANMLKNIPIFFGDEAGDNHG
jgi:hypothetical protein|tara:strand:- start:1110 stop:1313 length:204 start_codon:yes stop_codon:yes gene_type:complete